MKKTIFTFLAVQSLLASLNAQNVTIPDANFKAYLVGYSAINTNGDSEIQTSEATAYSGVLNCSNQSISDLTGIEAFSTLTTLNCSNNSLATINVAQNTALQSLIFSDNQLTSIDISTNTALTLLKCNHNQMTGLNLSNNPNLATLECYNNNISSLDLSQHSAIVSVYAYNNILTSVNVANGNNASINNMSLVNNPSLTCIQVDAGFNPPPNGAGGWYKDATASYNSNCVSSPCTVNIPDANFKSYLVGNTAINTNGDTEIQCTEASAFTGIINVYLFNISDMTGLEAFTSLTELNCSENYNLSSLDVSQNVELTYLSCQDLLITSLDLSQNPDLTTLICNFNSLLTSLDLSNNSNLTTLYVNNGALTSLNVANGNNNNVVDADFIAYNNPDLFCVQVDDDAYSTSNWTNIDSQTNFSTSCGGNVGLDEINSKKLTIYPNPVSNQLFFDLEGGQIKYVEIIDYTGRVIKSIDNVNLNNIDVSDINQGVYLVRIAKENGVFTSQFIKK